LVAPGLQDMLQHGGCHAAQLAGGCHAAQLAGREAEWDLQQLAAVQGDQAEDEPDQEGNGQDLFDLRGRTRPQVPPAAVGGADVIGWRAIDRLGGWDAFLVECSMLQEVPEQHKGAWANAWTEVLRKVHDAETDEEKDGALQWLSFLSQGQLRKPTRGGRAGKRQVALRFNSLIAGDWGALVELWLKDKEKTVADRTWRERQRREEMVEAER
jgi:hypothetical protein